MSATHHKIELTKTQAMSLEKLRKELSQKIPSRIMDDYLENDHDLDFEELNVVQARNIAFLNKNRFGE